MMTPRLALDILFSHTAGFNPGDKEVRLRDLQEINALFTKLSEEGMRMEWEEDFQSKGVIEDFAY